MTISEGEVYSFICCADMNMPQSFSEYFKPLFFAPATKNLVSSKIKNNTFSLILLQTEKGDI